MARSSFDPFAVHPFTNSSVILPQAPMPSQYYSQPTSFVATAPIQIMAPSPKRPVAQSKASSSSTHPVFTSFRVDTSSPDLVLKSKASPLSTQGSHIQQGS
ncbi:uncharacterized protein BT62DRAFT_925235 [Guyanagaster necrorhizus]|uniref:Uncharacterized protein n=1 Tax=Guyanagaster necrorhizus TaxID=856835 RepID=A0A9P7W3E8_9AGAR|nr:uncharacterized protein BT62DRAFT_925235 [Guyanagaster necrorhizus MCA 3950]KAG7452686.1 hypothetical protein BT62DRAFT_925235 [Guyanagaster necrorhizus MCA 3950]